VSFFRDNLKFRVMHKPTHNDKDGTPLSLAMLLEYVGQQPRGATGIVYCLSRDNTKEVAEWVRPSAAGTPALLLCCCAAVLLCCCAAVLLACGCWRAAPDALRCCVKWLLVASV
jgi:hypothetical protein